jgi:hypothetical protein
METLAVKRYKSARESPEESNKNDKQSIKNELRRQVVSFGLDYTTDPQTKR